MTVGIDLNMLSHASKYRLASFFSLNDRFRRSVQLARMVLAWYQTRHAHQTRD
jgi:hypothetical protein